VNRWIAALVAMIALVLAPAARAGCAARCAMPAKAEAARQVPASQPASAAAGPQHAHHHAAPRAESTSRPVAASMPTRGPAVRDTACGPGGGRGCPSIGETPAAAMVGRVLHDAVALAVHATIALPALPLAAGGPAPPAWRIRPAGPVAASLPLRI
jgi:hypothetical protein